MTHDEIPAGEKLPWHKPAFYELTGYIETSGTPTAKDRPHINNEDENRPFAPTRAKGYIPATL